MLFQVHGELTTFFWSVTKRQVDNTKTSGQADTMGEQTSTASGQTSTAREYSSTTSECYE